jgi:hypothetical protein
MIDTFIYLLGSHNIGVWRVYNINVNGDIIIRKRKSSWWHGQKKKKVNTAWLKSKNKLIIESDSSLVSRI